MLGDVVRGGSVGYTVWSIDLGCVMFVAASGSCPCFLRLDVVMSPVPV